MTFNTQEEKRQAFHNELKALLVKYDAELANNYDETIIYFNFDQNLYDKTGDGLIQDIELGSWMDGK